ncbi:uncharacterized protein LOC143377773 isoform X1 [Andrena cerasifolii]|uniref:uncharacterized protein LOC143377773 isoform X1 n=1 Tax=Andrena cerasifolii TaxID=2819439 RepID=UPI00403784B5
MAINIKFTKFDNTPWGFRLAGGSDFPQPLTVIKVLEGSLAECMGMKVGDVVVRLNDQPIGSLTHGQAHEELVRAGNNFVLGVQRGEDYLKAVEGLSEENIVPYKIPLADLPPVFPEQILKEETVIERYEETTYEEKPAEEEAEPEVEPLPDKPKDANSEIVPNQNLTDDEIAQLILEEEELLNDQGVLGVNFKKLRPRLPVLKQSKVVEELQNIATAEPPLVEQLRRTSVFLQKPQRPVPVPRKKQEEEEELTEVESYKVVIKKQQKRSITDRLLERGLLRPEGENTPEPPTPEVNMDSDEMGTKIEEDDASSSSSSSFVSSEALDDGPRPQRQQPIATCSTVFPPCLEAISSLSIEPAPFERDDNTDVAQIQLSRRKENAASARRSPSKRRAKRFYTRAHYFRRCLFGKRGDAKKPAKVRPSVRERVQESESRDYGESRAPLAEELGSRRGSLEKACGSRMKGRYLETYFKREDNWIRRAVDRLLEKPDGFPSGKSFDRLLSSKEASSWRTRYAEKILARSVQFVAVRLRSDLFKHLERARSKDAGSPAESYPLTRKRMYFKGRYFQRLLSSNFARLMDRVKSASATAEVPRGGRRRSSAMIKMKGRYMEKCLLGSSFLDFPDRFSAPSAPPSKRRRLFARTRYGERFFKTHLEYLGLIMKYVRCQVLQGISDSSVVIPNCYSLNPSQNRPAVEEGVLGNLIRSSKDLIATEVFHRGSRRLSRSCRGSVSAPPGSSLLGNILSSFGLDFNWLPSKLVGGSADGAIGEKKAVLDADRDGRRLSFVPTILYEGLTNHIGVDFTRLVAYAFVPCTSIILLYMYK